MTLDEANAKVRQYAAEEPIQFFVGSCVASYVMSRILHRMFD